MMGVELEDRLRELADGAKEIDQYVAKMQSELKNNYVYGVERKSSGLDAVIHKMGDKVMIQSPSGKNLTCLFPTVAGQVLKLASQDFVVSCELLFVNSKKEPVDKSVVVEFLHSNNVGVELYEENVLCYLNDVVYLDGRDLTGFPWCDRRSLLRKFKYVGNVKESPLVIVKNKSEAEKALNLFSVLPGSGGVMVKRYTSKYRPNEESRDWFLLSKGVSGGEKDSNTVNNESDSSNSD